MKNTNNNDKGRQEYLKQMDLVHELYKQRDCYVKTITEKDSNSTIVDDFDRYSAIYETWQERLTEEVGARIEYQGALKQHKIDPFIAGGASHAAFGLGAGVYMGVTSADRNAQIDQLRNDTKNNVIISSSSRSVYEDKVVELANHINEQLKHIDYIKDVRNEYYYKLANRYLKSDDEEKKERAIKIFKQLGDYKDSQRKSTMINGIVEDESLIDKIFNYSPVILALSIIIFLIIIVAFGDNIYITEEMGDYSNTVMNPTFLTCLIIGGIFIVGSITLMTVNEVYRKPRIESQQFESMDIDELEEAYNKCCKDAYFNLLMTMPGHSNSQRDKAHLKYMAACDKGEKIRKLLERKTGKKYDKVSLVVASHTIPK